MRTKTYREMRIEGLCTKCGKPNMTPEYCMCHDCRQRDSDLKKERREYMKKIGKCVRCGKNESEPGKTMCLECAGKDSDNYYTKYRKRKLEKEKIYTQKKIEYRKNNSLCLSCGKRKSENGLCDVCKSYQRRYRNKNRNDIPRSERQSYGICYICGKAPVVNGKSVCINCYSVRLESIKKCIETRKDGFNDAWKNENKIIFRKKVMKNP